MKQIAIVGAGTAGLAAAQRLRKPDLVITLFDKSRGLGGRMATRRIEDLQFDHGAQYFTAKGPRFNQTATGHIGPQVNRRPKFKDKHCIG